MFVVVFNGVLVFLTTGWAGGEEGPYVIAPVTCVRSTADEEIVGWVWSLASGTGCFHHFKRFGTGMLYYMNYMNEFLLQVPRMSCNCVIA